MLALLVRPDRRGLVIDLGHAKGVDHRHLTAGVPYNPGLQELDLGLASTGLDDAAAAMLTGRLAQALPGLRTLCLRWEGNTISPAGLAHALRPLLHIPALQHLTLRIHPMEPPIPHPAAWSQLLTHAIQTGRLSSATVHVARRYVVAGGPPYLHPVD